MTNILATILVALVTNTVEVFPTRTVGVPCPCNEGANGFAYAVYCSKEEPIPNPTTKDIVTTVTRITTEQWSFPDGKILFAQEKNRELVSESRRHFVKDWQEVKGEPQKQVADFKAGPIQMSTNGLSTNVLLLSLHPLRFANGLTNGLVNGTGVLNP